MSLLCVTIKKARLQGSLEEFHSYVTVKLQNVKSTTIAVKGIQPSWEQEFVFETNRLDQGLILELWNKGVLWDKLLGVHFVPLNTIQYSVSAGQGKWLQIDQELEIKNGETIGTCRPTGQSLLVDLRFELPFDTQQECADVNDLQARLEALNNQLVETEHPHLYRAPFNHSGVSEDSDYTSDVSFPINRQQQHHANSSAHQWSSHLHPQQNYLHQSTQLQRNNNTITNNDLYFEEVSAEEDPSASHFLYSKEEDLEGGHQISVTNSFPDKTLQYTENPDIYTGVIEEQNVNEEIGEEDLPESTTNSWVHHSETPQTKPIFPYSSTYSNSLYYEEDPNYQVEHQKEEKIPQFYEVNRNSQNEYGNLCDKNIGSIPNYPHHNYQQFAKSNSPPPPQPQPPTLIFKENEKISPRRVIYDYNNKIFPQQQQQQYNNQEFYEDFNHQEVDHGDHEPRIVQPNGHFSRINNNNNRLMMECEEDEEYDVEMDDYSGVEEELGINEENEEFPQLHNFKQNQSNKRYYDSEEGYSNGDTVVPNTKFFNNIRRNVVTDPEGVFSSSSSEFHRNSPFEGGSLQNNVPQSHQQYSINRYSQEESANSQSNSSATLTENRGIFGGPTKSIISSGGGGGGADSDGFTSTSTVIPQIYNNSPKRTKINKIQRNFSSSSSSSTKFRKNRNFREEEDQFKSGKHLLPSENELIVSSTTQPLPYSNIPQCLSNSSIEEDYEAQLVATGRRYDSRPYSTDGYTSSAMGGIVSSSGGGGADGSGPGAYTTPTPNYDEYQCTPTRYNIALDGSLVSTIAGGDLKLEDEEERKLQDSDQYYFNENYVEQPAEDFYEMHDEEPLSYNSQPAQIMENHITRPTRVNEYVNSQQNFQRNSIENPQTALAYIQEKEHIFDKANKIPNGDISYDNSIHQKAFIEDNVQFEPVIQQMASCVEIITPKDYKGLWKWAYREACKQAGIQVGPTTIVGLTEICFEAIICEKLVENWFKKTCS